MIATRYSDFRALFAPGAPTANDGLPEWPILYVLNLGPGFPSPVSGIQFTFPIVIDMDPGFSDAVPGVDEWDWYLQMPTEAAPLTNRLVLQRSDSAAPTVTNSARARLALTSVGAAINVSQTPASIELLFRDVHLFVRNRFTGNIYVWDLYRAAFAEATYL